SRLIQSARSLTQEQLLRQLNPLLRGWANYFRNGAATRTFEKLYWHVHRVLWRWIHHRHPNKSYTWKKRKYFLAIGDKGLFSTQILSKKGELRTLALYRMASTKIQRHIKVRGIANPYDPNYTEYFRKRRCFAWRVR